VAITSDLGWRTPGNRTGSPWTLQLGERTPWQQVSHPKGCSACSVPLPQPPHDLFLLIPSLQADPNTGALLPLRLRLLWCRLRLRHRRLLQLRLLLQQELRQRGWGRLRPPASFIRLTPLDGDSLLPVAASQRNQTDLLPAQLDLGLLSRLGAQLGGVSLAHQQVAVELDRWELAGTAAA
jgi:hypothetical protein